jgi:hypothetical protein
MRRLSLHFLLKQKLLHIGRMDPAGLEPASATVTECCVPITLRALGAVFRSPKLDCKVAHHNCAREFHSGKVVHFGGLAKTPGWDKYCAWWVAPGGRCQWALDAICQIVEWPSQPLRFDSVVLRTASRLDSSLLQSDGLVDSVSAGNSQPRLTSGAFACLASSFAAKLPTYCHPGRSFAFAQRHRRSFRNTAALS